MNINELDLENINEIDTSDDYDVMKKEVYELASERIVQSIEEIWINANSEMKLYASGGTTLNINGLGAVPVNRNASTAVTTIYPVGAVLILTYSGEKWLTADYDANTKNSAGTSNKTGSKMYLVGATSQTSSGTTTYTNTNAYIGTDNCLYSGGKKVVDVSSAITVTGIDANGVSHSWTMYGVAQ